MLKELRKAKGMTMDELAKASGVSRVSINRYELGDRVPDIIIASKLARALDCKIEELVPHDAGRKEA